jgi:uncharacterized protein YndB with AHSA1/START domain
MKYLCLAYGDESAWNALTKKEQDALLAQDEVLRNRGDLVVSVHHEATVMRAWDGKPTTADGPFADSNLPLAGFGILEAKDLKEAISLVTSTPCARAKGAIEIRSISAINEWQTAPTHVRAKVTMLIQAPPEKVYMAFVEPQQLTQFWLSKASGPLRVGTTVHWNFWVEGAEVSTTATIMDIGRKLSWDWSDKSKVSIDFEALDGETAVTLVNDHFPQEGNERVCAALTATEGFAIVLADLKTLLESGTSAGITKAKAKLIKSA